MYWIYYYLVIDFLHLVDDICINDIFKMLTEEFLIINEKWHVVMKY